MGKKRSKGITWLAVFYIIGGTIILILYLKYTISPNTYRYPELYIPIVLFNTIGLVGFITGVGLLKLKKWAQILGIGFSAIVLLVNLFWIYNAGKNWEDSILFYSISSFISIFTIIFLTRPKVNEQFTKEPG